MDRCPFMCAPGHHLSGCLSDRLMQASNGSYLRD